MNLPKLKQTAIALAMLATGATAHAGVFNETEPNNTLATAQVISDPGSMQTVINGARSFNDPSDDFFRFMVSAPGALTITSSSTNAFADSVMGLFGPIRPPSLQQGFRGGSRLR